jgi:WD40 repeat protein
MKHLRLSLGLIVVVLVFGDRRAPSTQAQTVESSSTQDACHVDRALIWNVDFSSDGEFLTATWPPHSIRIWNALTGAVVATLTDDLIDSQDYLVFSPDNKLGITGRHDGVIILWDIRTGRKIRTFSSPKNLRTSTSGEQVPVIILAKAFSPDGQSILATYPATGHMIWNLASGAEEAHLIEDGAVYSEFSPDGNSILTQLEIGPISLWDRRSGKLLHTFDGAGPISRGMFSRDGRYILVPTRDETVMADAKTFRTVHILGAATSRWQFSPDGKYVMARKEPGTVFLWETERGKLLHEFWGLTPAGYEVMIYFGNSAKVVV